MKYLLNNDPISLDNIEHEVQQYVDDLKTTIMKHKNTSINILIKHFHNMPKLNPYDHK